MKVGKEPGIKTIRGVSVEILRGANYAPLRMTV